MFSSWLGSFPFFSFHISSRLSFQDSKPAIDWAAFTSTITSLFLLYSIFEFLKWLLNQIEWTISKGSIQPPSLTKWVIMKYLCHSQFIILTFEIWIWSLTFSYYLLQLKNYYILLNDVRVANTSKPRFSKFYTTNWRIWLLTHENRLHLKWCCEFMFIFLLKLDVLKIFLHNTIPSALLSTIRIHNTFSLKVIMHSSRGRNVILA